MFPLKVTTTERDDLDPVLGMFIYNTDHDWVECYIDAGWVVVAQEE